MSQMSSRLQSVERRDSRRKAALGLAAVFMVVAAVCLGLGAIGRTSAEESMFLKASAAILVDVETGEVLYQQNADQPLPPASMSKMMTELLVLDHIYNGDLRWNDMITASAYAGRIPGSRMGLAEGDSVMARELFEAMAVHSANDAAVALAEHIAGSEEAFAVLMNERAASIGMSSGTVFGNASGLAKGDLSAIPGSAHKRDTVISARDTARLAGYLIGKFPEVLEVSSRSSVKVSTSKQALAATNWMLANQPYAYPGSDGLKTGYTPYAGYCFTGTVKQGNKRLISVVMGTDSKESRFRETSKLYQIGFKSSSSKEV